MDFDDFSFSEEEFANAEQQQNEYLVDAGKGLSLITCIIASPAGSSLVEQQQRLVRFHQLIHDDFLSLSAKDDFPKKTAVFRELLVLAETLADIVAFPYLATKTIIGVGGSFGAGKSRFLNTLCGINLLPEALEPSTAIPTYLTYGKKQSLIALNAFNFEVELDVSALNAVSHAFHRHYKEALGEEVGFAHMLRVLMIQQPHFVWQHLALLDTPGYSKADVQTNRSDAELAKQQLSEADHIIWLVSAKNGSVRQDDIDFLRSLNHKNPLFLVVTQADLMPVARLPAVINAIRDGFVKAQIPIAGLMAWQAPINSQEGVLVQGDDIKIWLKKLNIENQKADLAQDCACIIDSCIDHHQKKLTENQEQLSLLKRLMGFSQMASLRKNFSSDEDAELQRMVEEQKNIQQNRKAQIDELLKIKIHMVSVIQSILEEYNTTQTPDLSVASKPKAKHKKDAPLKNKALLAFKAAAELGDAEAQFNLACMYDNGKSVPKDETLAAEWYNKAATQGYAEAQFQLGVAYANGWGVQQDAIEAADWIKKAAQQGHAEAQYQLGVAYANGWGVQQGAMKAKFWLKKAVEQGHPRASKPFEDLY